MAPALELRDIHKSYGGNRVLLGVSLTAEAGTVTGLIGANGAGKSTLVKVATGQVSRDGGEIYRDGEMLQMRDPRDARKAAIAVVPQELSSLFNMPVSDAVVIGAEPSRGIAVYTQKQRARAAQSIFDRLGLDIPMGALVGMIPPSQQRLVSLAGALHRGAKVVFLDEPTAAMAADDAAVVLRTIRALAADGVAVVFVSHRFAEVMQVCDVVHAMRDGREVWVRPRSGLKPNDLISAITTETHLPTQPSGRDAAEREPVLVAENASGDNFTDVSLTLGKGEILGITGLVGCGLNEFVETVGGARPVRGGRLLVDGREARFRCPADALARGVALLVAERARSAFLGMSVRGNASISTVGRIGKLGLISAGMERAYLRKHMPYLGVEDKIDEPLAALSGGNRQKVLLSRIVLAGARILVLDDPTAGVDVGARATLHKRLRSLADDGVSIIVSASEPEELLGFADRIAVMASGRLVDVFDNEDVDAARLMSAVTGVSA